MAEITIEVPESLAERLSAVRDRLPEVLARGLDESSPALVEVYRYVLEFLASDPSPETIVDFKPTPAMQERISELLEKNREGQLTAAESAELDEYVRIDTLLSSLKARAFRLMKTSSP
jgi:hypothetical protein